MFNFDLFIGGAVRASASASASARARSSRELGDGKSFFVRVPNWETADEKKST